MTTIILDNLTEQFGENRAVNAASFTLAAESPAALLVPSASGYPPCCS